VHRLGREDVPVLAPDHQLDHLVVALRALGEGLDVLAVAEHRADVGERLDLVHAVRDVEDRETVRPQAGEDLVDLLDIGGGQRRGRLVEDQELRVAAERLGDLNHLAARERKVAHPLHGVHVGTADAGEELAGDLALPPAVDQAEATRRIGDADVVGDRQVGHQRQLLEDADDARPVGGDRRGEAHASSLEEHLALGRLHDAGHDLDQGRLAGAVLAQHRMDGAALAAEVDLVQRAHAAVVLADAAHLPERRTGRTVAHGKRPALIGRLIEAGAARPGRTGRRRLRCYWSASLWPMISTAVMFTSHGGNSFGVKKLSVRSG
jgi:hypothetical protein